MHEHLLRVQKQHWTLLNFVWQVLADTASTRQTQTHLCVDMTIHLVREELAEIRLHILRSESGFPIVYTCNAFCSGQIHATQTINNVNRF